MAAPMKKNVPRRRPKNRLTKLHVIFNEDKRKEFLGGFKKRKDERRRKGREELELKLKEERKQMKQERKEMLLNLYQQQSSLPEVENIVEPVTFDLKQHTVTITSITDVDFQGKNNMLLGQNKDFDEEDDKGEPEISSTFNEKSANGSLKETKKKTSKKITSTKAFKMKQKLRQKQAQSKTRKKKKILSKRDKHKGRRGLNM